MLAPAVSATFSRRGTLLPTKPVALTIGFATHPPKQSQWAAFVQRGRRVTSIPAFDEVIELFGKFIWPASLAASDPEASISKGWSPAAGWV